MQVAELLTFAQDSCNIPLSFWKAESAEGNAAKAVDNIMGTLASGDMRRIALLRVVRALYDKPKCSFEVPPDLYGRKDDVYYFPDGVAFGKISKGTAYMAASILAANPAAKMNAEARRRGLRYVPAGRALGDAPVPEAASSSSQTATIKKKPAAAKPKPGASK